MSNTEGRRFRAGLLSCATMRPWLEVELCADLNSAWYVGARHLSKVGVAHDRVNTAEVSVVERIEVLAAQLEPDVFSKIQVLDARQIPIL